MDETWIRQHLSAYLDSSKTNVRLETQGSVEIGCSIAVMVKMFASVSPTYAALSATPQAQPQGGWQKYFDDWKAKGIIS